MEMDEVVKDLIKICQETEKEQFKLDHNEIFICNLNTDRRICNYQRNKVSLPRYVNGTIILREYYICGKKDKDYEV